MADKENRETNDIDDSNDNTNWDKYIANRDKEKQDESIDLSNGLDDAEHIDSEEDNAELEADLSQFVDEDSASADEVDGGVLQYEENISNKQSEQSEEPRKINEEEKQKKVKSIKKMAIAASSAVVIIAVLLVVWTLVQGRALSYVLTYTSEVDGVTQTNRISTNDFKLLIVYSEESWNPLEDAMDFLLNLLTIEQAAKARNLTLSDDELQEIREVAQQDIDFIAENIPQLSRVSMEFIERVHSFFYFMPKVIDGILDEVGFVLDEEEFARELADYKIFMQLDYVDATLHHIVLSSEERAIEAKAAFESGLMTFEEVLMEFFYNAQIEQMEGVETIEELIEQYGYESLEEFMEGLVAAHTVTLWDLGEILPHHVLTPENINHLVSLEIGEASNVIRVQEEAYLVVILDEIEFPSDDVLAVIHAELEEMFMDMYLNEYRWEAFQTEFQKWQEAFEAGMTINFRALESLNIGAILDW